ncbi:hypothetical protein [Paenarthrobacter sp. CAP02]|uniref:hypothetical protein n=1 Tax=Paenarthrobacter sp. CAP02 TaxID=3158144 RepID=UPI0032DAFC3F
MISDEAAEAAARVYEPEQWNYFDENGAGEAGSPVALMRNRSLSLARRVLEAAAPFIAAQALDEAEQFHARLPDGTGNGRAYKSHQVALMLREQSDAYRYVSRLLP